MELKIAKQAPDVHEFMCLRNKIGWINPDVKVVQTSLANTILHICVYKESQLVGYGRVVGDGAVYFYLQDIIVDPGMQKQGIGTLVMQEIERFLAGNAVSGATIALLAAQGKEAFYAKFGYRYRAGKPLGFGMCKFIE